MWIRKVSCLSWLALCVSCSLAAQSGGNSPYSRFGLGDLVPEQYAPAVGMGGLSAAYQPLVGLNVVNPASYGSLRVASFQVGARGGRTTLTDAKGQEGTIYGGNLNSLALGFPLRNPNNEIFDGQRKPLSLGMIFSLAPYSRSNYDITSTDTSPTGEDIVRRFVGAGSTYRLQTGIGGKYRNWSGGVNLGYFFGNLDNRREILLNRNIGNGTDGFFTDDISLSGIHYRLGAQYRLYLGDPDPNATEGEESRRESLVFGLYGNGSTAFTATTTQVYTGISGSGIDTVRNTADAALAGRLPGQIGFGLHYERLNKLRLGVEYVHNAWQDYLNEAQPETLKNSYRLALGVEYIPDLASYNRYRDRIHYRAGAYYGTDPRGGPVDLTEIGLSFGVGLPIVRRNQATSFVDLALELGQFGNEDLLQTNYVRLSVGFSLNDNSWFLNRKFN